MSSTIPSACDSGFSGAHIQPPDHDVAPPSTERLLRDDHVEPVVGGGHRAGQARRAPADHQQVAVQSGARAPRVMQPESRQMRGG